MLRLFLNVVDKRLRVREASAYEEFQNPIRWNKLEFLYTKETNYMMAWTSLLPDLPPEYALSLLQLAGDRYPFSERYEELKSKCHELVYPLTDTEWVLFGGSFNPWHGGHQACLELLPENKTCFILPDVNPHKEERERNSVSEVLAVSAKARFGANQFLSPTFIHLNRPNPTVGWMERLSSTYPNIKKSLLIGFDSFKSLPTWTRAQELMPLIDCLYVVSRLEQDSERENFSKKVRALNPEVTIEFLGHHEYELLSSTELRKK